MFKILNIQSVSYVCQRPISCIEKYVRTCVILRSYPLTFQDSSKCFDNVQMWGVWRQEEKEESPLFPYRPKRLYPAVPMHYGINKHDKGILADAEGKVVKKTDYLVCRHLLGGGEPFIPVVTDYHTEDVEPCNPLGRDTHPLLPTAIRMAHRLMYRYGSHRHSRA